MGLNQHDWSIRDEDTGMGQDPVKTHAKMAITMGDMGLRNQSCTQLDTGFMGYRSMTK